MDQAEETKRDKRWSGLTSVLKRRHDDTVEINEYRIGEIRAEKPVIVANRGILVGDLLAPEVVVSGLVYGYVASRRLVVAPGGQIWGDVYVSALELALSGKINGWITTLDAGTVDLLRAKEIGTGDLPAQANLELPGELINKIENSGADIESDQLDSQRRSGIWRQLRSEAALALIARSEIEATLEQRLEEALAAAGELKATDSELVDGESDEAAEPEQEEPANGETRANDAEESTSTEVAQLRTQLRQATAAAQKYYGELLWTRAELRAAQRGDGDE